MARTNRGRDTGRVVVVRIDRPAFSPAGALHGVQVRRLLQQVEPRYSSQLVNNHFTEICSGSEAGSYLRRMDFVYHSTLGLRVIKKREVEPQPLPSEEGPT